MPRKLPKLCRKKDRNLAYVTDPLSGNEVYLGPWGSGEARQNYDDWIVAFLKRKGKSSSSAISDSDGMTVARLAVLYMEFAKVYYRKNGRETSEIHAIKGALRPLVERFGKTSIEKFGTTELKDVRQAMIDLGWSRNNINKQVQRVQRLFKWGVAENHVPGAIYGALLTVPWLKEGRTLARERDPVSEVPMSVVERTLPRLDPVVKAMVQLQLFADMRPGEMVMMRPCDIDQSGPTWLYVPLTHKTAHHKKQRRIWLGPKARETLKPILDVCPSPESWLFPTRARGKHYDKRKTHHWSVSGYRKAIRLACEQRPKIPRWHPHQLRHTMTSLIESEHGVESAQRVAGHSSLNATKIYSERNDRLARETAEKIG